ncbi:unnamed protein product [Notodromas monacha]|uniref:ABC transporter domain-containing protein n=1 Tax=Notodromas monacha TaxID=399045 RepID=A0A7R9BRG1_9CRUS|nr:unnamed protein product [Notodromas monacha]CAG0920343.1 unnamed protein product [Notodromas monacha]
MVTGSVPERRCVSLVDPLVEPGTWFQKMVGSVRTDVILRDVSFEIHSGEVMAILGSKGSGKRALLESISRRAQGARRGKVMLNKVPVTQKFFQKNCGNVGPGTAASAESRRGGFVKKRVPEVGDCCANCPRPASLMGVRCSEISLYTVFAFAVVLLLDEPTWGLDPLNTYFIVSILSNHARKRRRIVVLTMEKPRSDIFPFLDRVAYLSLGVLVYAGPTRRMLDYFRSIGFPCPELENPLMYYLCLSTVDRRSRERLLESNNQIAALVDRFKTDGEPFLRSAGPPPAPDLDSADVHGGNKVPLTAYGKPGTGTTLWTLVKRNWSYTLSRGRTGRSNIFLRLLLLPLVCGIIGPFFYYDLEKTQQTLMTRSSLIFNSIMLVSAVSAVVTAKTYAPLRTRYYQEVREGAYGPGIFLFSLLLHSLPLTILSVLGGSALLYWPPHWRTADVESFFLVAAAMFATYMFVEQQTVAILLVVKSSFMAALVSLSMLGLPDWLYYLSYVLHYRYVGAFLHDLEFAKMRGTVDSRVSALGLDLGTRNGTIGCASIRAEFGCRYYNGSSFLQERYYVSDEAQCKRDPSGLTFLSGPNACTDDLQRDLNFGLMFLFPVVMFLANFLLYYFPLPAFLKTKFRE